MESGGMMDRDIMDRSVVARIADQRAGGIIYFTIFPVGV